jgi:predicted RNA-binding Zn ribbon-like protein
VTRGRVRTHASLDLVGGALVLDFANTINSRLEPVHDYLADYEDLLAWGERAGIVGPRDRPPLARHDRVGAAAARAARRRREVAYRVFSAVAAGRRPPNDDASALLRAYAGAMAEAELEPTDGGFRPVWPPPAEPAAILRPLDASAGELLLSPEVELVKECPGCGWLFLDRSRNRSRRWCDMQVCGSRAKMRRYYVARRARPAGSVS